MDTGPPWPLLGTGSLEVQREEPHRLAHQPGSWAKVTDAEPGVMTTEPLLHSLVLLRSWSPVAV